MPAAPGLPSGPKVLRITIPTVDEPLWRGWMAAYERPRVVLLEDFKVPLPRGGYVIIPKGFDSDGGSVPLFALLLFVAIGNVVSDYGWTGYLAWLNWSDWIGIGLLFLGLMLNPFGLLLAPFLVHDFALRYKVLIKDDGTLMCMRSVWHGNSVMSRVTYATNKLWPLGQIAYIGVTVGAWMSWSKHRRRDGTTVNSLRQWKRLINEDETYA